jgi:signal transduction histidine kinase
MVLFSGIVSAALWTRPFSNSNQPPPSVHLVVAIGFPVISIAIPAMMIAALVCVVLRFRRSRGEERLQMKWFTLAAVFVVLTFVIDFAGSAAIVQILSNFAILGLWIAIGIAMLKYRLYDIDVVIRKTLVGGLLVAFVTVVYVVVVAGIGALGSQYSFLHSGPLIAAATAIIAIAFQPVLRRARHLANRLVYGDRATPYEVLSEFSERMGGTVATNDIPQRMATIVGEGTGATGATVWLHVGGELRPDAVWPEDAVVAAAVRVAPSASEFSVPDASRTFPIRHQDELLGALSVVMPPQEPLAGEQEKLCFDLAAQAGLVLRNVLLIEELHASRQRLVAAGDEERRKLERNIHDGAQQQLVALAIKIRLAKSLAAKDAAKAEAMLDEVAAEATDALENLRDLARGIYPPLLADKGLAAALEAQARKSSVPVTVAADGLGRYPQEAEAAVYFCVLEGLQNIGKYAEASAATVTLSQTNGSLAFEVADDGKGFDPDAIGYGTGLQGIADRLAAMDGTLAVKSEPGKGTSLTGRLPVSPSV